MGIVDDFSKDFTEIMLRETEKNGFTTKEIARRIPKLDGSGSISESQYRAVQNGHSRITPVFFSYFCDACGLSRIEIIRSLFAAKIISDDLDDDMKKPWNDQHYDYPNNSFTYSLGSELCAARKMRGWTQENLCFYADDMKSLFNQNQGPSLSQDIIAKYERHSRKMRLEAFLLLFGTLTWYR